MRRFLAFLLFAPALFAAEPVIPIAGYHQVEEVPKMGWSVSVEDFTDQMRYLQAAGYHVIPIATLYDYLAGGTATLPPHPIVITADDGFVDSYTNLNGVIAQFRYPWSLYVYPNFIDSRGATALTWAQVKELAQDGVDVESHTMTHPHLIRRLHRKMSDADYALWLHGELADSKRVIEQETGKPVRFLCYPYGDWDAGVIAEAKRDGYLAGVTSWAGLNTRGTSPFELHRSLLESDTTLAMFAESIGALPVGLRDISVAHESVGVPATITAVVTNPRDLDPSTVRLTLLGEQSVSSYDPRTGLLTARIARYTHPRQHVVVSGERASDHRVVTTIWTFYTSAEAKQRYDAGQQRLRNLPLSHTKTTR